MQESSVKALRKRCKKQSKAKAKINAKQNKSNDAIRSDVMQIKLKQFTAIRSTANGKQLGER
jgi:hypothetical protein